MLAVLRFVQRFQMGEFFLINLISISVGEQNPGWERLVSLKQRLPAVSPQPFSAFERSSMPLMTQQMKPKVISGLESVVICCLCAAEGSFQRFRSVINSACVSWVYRPASAPQASNLPSVTAGISNADHVLADMALHCSRKNSIFKKFL